MELREFAAQVLFGRTLDEKLRRPESITDHAPGASLAAPALPGRPTELRFKASGGKSDFPGARRLENERERGRLLHFFANHELLATELMALVLLRFPDAPAEFRRGVLRTLQDEQMHTRLYLQRMRECGIEFGELPVSGYFWRAVAPMESPLDFVAGLSLTFEQANLDFARQFSHDFAAMGDTATARLLDRIYRDEIAHVAHGLKWLRRWKNPKLSDWEAYCGLLKFPLSPQRAKGIHFNAEGRGAAGLDPAFIAALKVHAQSKGRTPGVFVFNPFAEGYIAQGKSFMPIKHQTRLAEDLANLPQFLCRQDDLVLVPRRPSVEFLETIQQAGLPLPEFVEFDPQATAPLAVLSSRNLGGLRPWAWAPDSVELLAPLFGNVTVEPRTADQSFNDSIASLYSKAWSAELLRKLLRQTASKTAPASWLCTEAEVGTFVDTLNDALGAIAAIRRRGHHRIVVKQALGLAGQSAIRLWEPAVLEAQRRWMAGALEQGRPLIVEPWLERALDFSVQLEMTSRGLLLCGYTGLLNDPKGQYQGNWASPQYARRMPTQVLKLFASSDHAARIHRLYEDLRQLLEGELRRADFIGPVGIDAFIYRATGGELRLKPVVEINPRYTMGRLLVELMKRTCPGSHGVLRLVNRAQMRADGAGDFMAYAHRLRERRPLQIEGHPTRRIREGAVCLNDPARAQVCLACFEVGREPFLLGPPQPG